MFQLITSLLHRHGAVSTLRANLNIGSIHAGDILTHRKNYQKYITAHVEHNHILLVNMQGRISKIRKDKAIKQYCRCTTDLHSHQNVQKAFRRARNALINDNRLLTLLGLRPEIEEYLGQIEKEAV